mgnify:CR=1 FL=1
MIEREIDNGMMQFEYTLSQQGLNLDQYLTFAKKSKEEIRSELTGPSEQRLRLKLLIETLINDQKFEVSEEEIETEIQSWNHEKIKSITDLTSSKTHDIEVLKQNLMDKKARDLLVSSAKIK